MTQYYNHPGLIGEALHYAKVEEMATNVSLPFPTWEGQLIAQGNSLYYAQKIGTGTNAVLTWRQITTPFTQGLPSNAVTYTISTNAPVATSGSGKIHYNSTTGEVFFLANSSWIKIGPKLASGQAFSTEGITIGSGACSAGNFNTISLSNLQTNSRYGFIVFGYPYTLAGTGGIFNIYPVNSLGQKSSAVATFNSSTAPFNGLEIIPSSWSTGFQNLFQIRNEREELTFPPSGPPVSVKVYDKLCCFSYDADSRIIRIEGVFNP